jgi:hypothetical protein
MVATTLLTSRVLRSSTQRPTDAFSLTQVGCLPTVLRVDPLLTPTPRRARASRVWFGIAAVAMMAFGVTCLAVLALQAICE